MFSNTSDYSEFKTSYQIFIYIKYSENTISYYSEIKNTSDFRIRNHMSIFQNQNSHIRFSIRTLAYIRLIRKLITSQI